MTRDEKERNDLLKYGKNVMSIFDVFPSNNFFFFGLDLLTINYERKEKKK